MNTTKLTERFEAALIYATRLHANQTRKVGGVPYISHLMSVAALVLEAGGSEDEAIAALLHDAVEDQGGKATREEIHRLFGDVVVAIVDGCTESDTQPKPPRKTGKMTLTFNPDKYKELLAKYQQKLIMNEDENDQTLAIVEELMHRHNRSPEEDELYELLITLV